MRYLLCLWTWVAIFIIVVLVIATHGEPSEGKLSLGLYNQVGVTSLQSFSGDANLKYVKNGNELSLGASVGYAKSGDTEVTNKGNIYGGFDPIITDRWALWSFGKGSYDKIRLIDFERSLGGGVKYTFPGNFSTSLGYLSYVRYADGDRTTEGRFSVRLKGKKDLGSSMKTGVVIFYQPKSNDINDYILDAQAHLTFKISNRLGLSFKVEDEYRSITLASEKNNLITTLNLVFSF